MISFFQDADLALPAEGHEVANSVIVLLRSLTQVNVEYDRGYIFQTCLSRARLRLAAPWREYTCEPKASPRLLLQTVGFPVMRAQDNRFSLEVQQENWRRVSLRAV